MHMERVILKIRLMHICMSGANHLARKCVSGVVWSLMIRCFCYNLFITRWHATYPKGMRHYRNACMNILMRLAPREQRKGYDNK